MGAGELTLTGGADRLMEGEFSYNVSDWKPEVSYDASGEEGEFAVKQGGASGAGPSGGHATSGTSASTTNYPPTSWFGWALERANWIWTASP